MSSFLILKLKNLSHVTSSLSRATSSLLSSIQPETNLKLLMLYSGITTHIQIYVHVKLKLAVHLCQGTAFQTLQSSTYLFSSNSQTLKTGFSYITKIIKEEWFSPKLLTSKLLISVHDKKKIKKLHFVGAIVPSSTETSCAQKLLSLQYFQTTHKLHGIWYSRYA